MNFKDINFGQASAEKENAYEPHLLLEGFLDNGGITTEARDGRKFLFLGYKGSGKSALSHHLKLTQDESVLVNLELLDDFPYETFEQATKSQRDPKASFPVVWSWLLLLRVLESFSKDEGAKVGVSFLQNLDALRNAGLLQSPELKHMLAASVKKKFSVKFQGLGLDTENGDTKDFSLSMLVRHLRSLVSEFQSGTRHILIIDGLDKVLAVSPIQYESLAALILEADRLNLMFAEQSCPAKILVLCRTDLFERLPAPDKNKIRQDSAVELDWHLDLEDAKTSPLVHLVNLRANLDRRGGALDVLEEFFPSQVHNKPVAAYLLQHTSRLRKNEVATYNAVQVWRLCG